MAFDFLGKPFFLHIDAVKDNFEEALKWLPGHLQISDTTVKKIIICIRSIIACQLIFNWILDEMIIEGSKKQNCRHVAFQDRWRVQSQNHGAIYFIWWKNKASNLYYCLWHGGKHLRCWPYYSLGCTNVTVILADVQGMEDWAMGEDKDEALKCFLTKENDIVFIKENILKMFQLKGMQNTVLLELPKTQVRCKLQRHLHIRKVHVLHSLCIFVRVLKVD